MKNAAHASVRVSLMFILAILLGATAHAQYADQVEIDRRERPIRPDRPDRLIYVSAGEVRVNKVVDDQFTFIPSNWNERILRIQVVGVKNAVRIKSAVVVFHNGASRNLFELTGRLSEGRRMGAYIDRYESRDIREVRIIATSDQLIGSRGEFRLEFGIVR